MIMKNGTSNPLITVIMPAYNVAPYIEGSVKSVIDQTYTNWELLILEDRSTDDTYAIAQKLAQSDERIRVIQNEKNSGVAKTRNRGIQMAQGTYIALLDSDDQWYPEKLERQLALIQRENAQISYCSYAMVSEQGEKVHRDYLVPAETDFKKMLLTNVIGCSTVMLQADIAKKHPFDETFYHEDYVLWLTLLKEDCRAVGCTEVLVAYCVRGDSRSAKKFSSAKKRWLIYRKHVKLSFFKSAYYMIRYAIAGLRKYA